MKKILFFLWLIAVVSMFSPRITKAIPVEFSGNGHFYEAILVPGGISWINARNQAIAKGGYLATITSDNENNFVFSLINDPVFWFVDGASNSQGPYIGGYQDNDQSSADVGWNWVTGEPWCNTHWAPGEPNDAGSGENPFYEDNDENYLQYFRNGNSGGNPILGNTWNDIPSYIGPKGYVIEWNDNPVPEPSTCLLLLFGLVGMVGIKKRFS